MPAMTPDQDQLCGDKDEVDDVVDDDLSYGRGCHNDEFREMKEVTAMIKSLNETFDDQVLREFTLERFIVIIDQYQEQPHLLDPHLAQLLEMMLSIVRNPNSHKNLVHLVFKYMYYVTKTRGFKVIVRLMPHEVVDLEPILNILQVQDNDPQTWETRYMLLLWLSIVCMIPFDMDRLDKQQLDVSERKTMDRILDAGKAYLGVFDKTRDAAAYVIAKFLSRPDVKDRRLGSFVDWALLRLDGIDVRQPADECWVYGLLTTFGLMFKHGKREDLLDVVPVLLNKLSQLDLLTCKSTGLRKLHVKVIQRLGLGFLKPRLAAWRYKRGNRSLMDNLEKKSGDTSTAAPSYPVEENDDEDYDIPEQLENIIEELLGGLRDKDTIVRWSAAKGIGRLSGRLPRELADEILATILDLFSDLAGDEPWHGGCLALAELGRRGLLLPDRLAAVIPIVLKALTYDEKRGNFSVGAHVRDAACYVCWAFARAYDPAEISQYVQLIASALLICSILDRDVNVRRAAAAAFQENVGRQGQFPHGIDILTTCDYFAVGSRRRCYLDLSVFVGQYSEYITTLIDHLVDVKLLHWDSKIRELSSQSLSNLCSKAPDYLSADILPKLVTKIMNYDLCVRHGAMLGVAQVIHGLGIHAVNTGGTVERYLTRPVLDTVLTCVKQLNDANLFRGLSGEFMRAVVCFLVQKCSQSALVLPAAVVDDWRRFVDDCLGHVTLSVRQAAIAAIPAFISCYFTRSSCSPIVEKYLRELTNATETTRMGFALAVGGLPQFSMLGSFRSVTCALISCITSGTLDVKQAEARRDAVKALASVCLTMGVQANGSPTECVCAGNVNEIYDTFFTALKDYTIDSARGDVGSYVREAAMDGLADLTKMIVNTAAELISPLVCEMLFTQIIQQANEKIDRTRVIAGEHFIALLHHKPEIMHVPDHKLLKTLFPYDARTFEERCYDNIVRGNAIVWEYPATTFPLFAQLLGHKVYGKPVLLGFAVSVGGLTESLVLVSRSALFSFVKSAEKEAMDMFTNAMLDIFVEFHKQNRVVLPALKMLDQLLDNDCFHLYNNDSSDTPRLLLAAVRKEMANEGDPNKLLAAVDVYCGMIQFSGDTRSKAIFSLMMLLCHKYPRVRNKAANKLYETLLMFDDVTDETSLEEVQRILSETLWDNSLQEIRPIRNQLCDLLNIVRPVLKNV